MTVTYDYYTDTFLGEEIDENSFPRYEAKAERLINQVTRGMASSPRLPSTLQEAVKDAICAQIEYYVLYGLDIAVAGRQGGGFTVGKVSVQAASNGNAQAGAASMVAPAALAYLEQTGLLNPAVATADMPWLWWY